MDIIGISNDNYQQFMTETQRQQSTLENFQALLDKATSAEAAGINGTTGTGETNGTEEADEVGKSSGTYGTSETDKENQVLREACESFESYFLQMMFREMRKTSFNQDGFIAKSNAEKIFTDMMDEETSKNAAKSGGIGLADMMYKQMTQFNTGVGSTTDAL